MRYRAFISYSHADAGAATWLHRKLEGWRVPGRMRAADPTLPEKLAPVFRDREELGSAGELGPKIESALADSGALIVLCSPDAARSRWVDSEVRSFRAGGRGDRVFALILDGEPHSGDQRECFPPSLRESEPLAADLRPGKDGKELALLKLIAGLLDVPLDALRQRDARRRHQRMLAVTALALVVMLVTSYLAVQASIARAAAERRQKQAEALVSFMLGDLNDKLSEVSRLDILDGVHDHAMEYFQSLPDDDLTPQVLEQRARALSRIGTVRFDRGRYPQALESYAAAEKLAGRLAGMDAASLPRQLEHAEILAYIGMVHWYQGALDEAQAAFDRARTVLVRAQVRAPDDPQLLFQLSTLDNNAGHVLEGRGRFEAATVHYRQMLVAAERLARLPSGRVEWRNQLGLAHNNLAKMALLRGDLPGAIAGYRADVAAEAAIVAGDVRNHAQAERLLLAQGALGRTLALAGELDEGADFLQDALDSARRLHEVAADNVGFTEDVGLYATQLARLRRLQGEAAAARTLVAEALAVFDKLVAQESANASWQRARAEALLERSQQAVDGSGNEDARAALREAISILEPQLEQSPEDRAVVLATAAARLGLASLAQDAERAQLAGRALQSLEAQASARSDPRLQALIVQALVLLSRREQAIGMARELSRRGMRDPEFLARMRLSRIPVPAATTPAVALP